MTEFIEFPKTKYRNGEAVVVDDAEAEKALGASWGDHPEHTDKRAKHDTK